MISEIIKFNYGYEKIATIIYNEIYNLKKVIIFLNGTMGVGKTTFSNTLFSKFGCSPIASSSYSLVTHFIADRNLVHCDFYRYSPNDDFFHAEIFPLLGDSYLLLIEWGMPQYLMVDCSHFCLDFSFTTNRCRKLNYYTFTLSNDL